MGPMTSADQGEQRAVAANPAGQRTVIARWLARLPHLLGLLNLLPWLFVVVTLGLIVAVNLHGWPHQAHPYAAPGYHSGLPWTCATRYAQARNAWWDTQPGKLKTFVAGAAAADALVWLAVLAAVVWVALRWRRWLGRPPRSTRWLAGLTCTALLLLLATGFEVEGLDRTHSYRLGGSFDSNLEHGFPLTYWTHPSLRTEASGCTGH